MQPLFRMFDTPCMYRGELVADCGKAKSGKTTFLSALMACAIGKHQVLSLERASEAPLSVVWLDTEQSQQSTQEILKERVVPLSETDGASLYAFNLRGLGYKARRRMVSVAIRTIKPDLVVIDGIKDLMTDINDAEQATLIMEQLMALANDHNCCIVCVLHLNKAEQDHNMRGSIGTELTNKAFEVFQCQRIGETDIFKVSQTYSRKQKITQKLYYQLDEQGLPVIMNGYQEQPRDEQGRFTTIARKTEELQQIFTEAMEDRHQRPYTELMGVAFKKCGFTTAKDYYAAVAAAEQQGIIRMLKHPESGANWVELCENTLPF